MLQLSEKIRLTKSLNHLMLCQYDFIICVIVCLSVNHSFTSNSNIERTLILLMNLSVQSSVLRIDRERDRERDRETDIISYMVKHRTTLNIYEPLSKFENKNPKTGSVYHYYP